MEGRGAKKKKERYQKKMRRHKREFVGGRGEDQDKKKRRQKREGLRGEKETKNKKNKIIKIKNIVGDIGSPLTLTSPLSHVLREVKEILSGWGEQKMERKEDEPKRSGECGRERYKKKREKT